jgi:hypothetical protein
MQIKRVGEGGRCGLERVEADEQGCGGWHEIMHACEWFVPKLARELAQPCGWLGYLRLAAYEQSCISECCSCQHIEPLERLNRKDAKNAKTGVFK